MTAMRTAVLLVGALALLATAGPANAASSQGIVGVRVSVRPALTWVAAAPGTLELRTNSTICVIAETAAGGYASTPASAGFHSLSVPAGATRITAVFN